MKASEIVPQYGEYNQKCATVILPKARYGSAQITELLRLESGLIAIHEELQTKSLIVDMSQIVYAGAGYLGVLARVHHRLRAAGCRLIVCGDCFELLRITRLNRVIKTFDDLGKAKEFCHQSDSVSH